MSHSLCTHRFGRTIASVIALCYVWLCTGASFQHTHCTPRRVPAYTAHETQQIQALAHRPTVKPIQTVATTQNPGHCAVCDWQAVCVPPAFVPATFLLVSAAAPRVVTTLPHYLSRDFFSRPARAPPTI